MEHKIRLILLILGAIVILYILYDGLRRKKRKTRVTRGAIQKPELLAEVEKEKLAAFDEEEIGPLLNREALDEFEASEEPILPLYSDQDFEALTAVDDEPEQAEAEAEAVTSVVEEPEQVETTTVGDEPFVAKPVAVKPEKPQEERHVPPSSPVAHNAEHAYEKNTVEREILQIHEKHEHALAAKDHEEIPKHPIDEMRAMHATSPGEVTDAHLRFVDQEELEKPEATMHIATPTEIDQMYDVDESEIDESVISIMIVPRKNKKFDGYKLLQTLFSKNMHYGAMHLFHYYSEDPNDPEKPLFSLASASTSGGFDLSTIKDCSYNGLILFMEPSEHLRPAEVFDLMVDTAKKLSIDLNGELKSQTNQHWTYELSEQIRERLEE